VGLLEKYHSGEISAVIWGIKKAEDKKGKM
jgi:hypothetical protein